ncbi:MAG TPA: toll/interleukin-1 receptor domain-containing protein [Ktedonosporobacter sp.]|nr:toll/interleukin-1 receptor domain-containing protein [Ktedonosporobacter sp.]
MAVETFISYAPKDKALRDQLATHLATLRRQGIIRDWYDGDIIAGTERRKEIQQHLNSAQIILLLISADYMASDFCYSQEMQQAIARHQTGQVRVIPILLRSTDYEGAPFAGLQVVPRNDRPVNAWPDKDAAFQEIVKEIKLAIQHLPAHP